MLISKELNEAINRQIGHELTASHQYLAIAAYFEQEVLTKTAKMFFKQAEEEREHAMKFIHYVLQAGGKPVVPPIAAPKADFASAEEALQTALKWEIETTDCINRLMDMAIEQKDYIGQDFLRWFVTEQLEEVSSMEGLLRIVQRAGEKNLIMLEAYLSHKE